MVENLAASKIQALWKKKKTFKNTANIAGWKYSASTLTSQIVSVDIPVDIESIFDEVPRGFTDIMGYRGIGYKAVSRYVKSHGWLGDETGVKKVIAKIGNITVSMTKDKVEVLGSGNYERAWLLIVQNGWVSKSLLTKKPVYVKIDGKFKLNTGFNLENLVLEFKSKIPKSSYSSVKPYIPEIFPSVSIKTVNPSIAYQIFENGTVLFTGIKDPKDVEVPKQVFKDLLSKLDKSMIGYGAAGTKLMQLSKKNKNLKKKCILASRYDLAPSYTVIPPDGFYIRPGTDGKPRYYVYKAMEIHGNGVQYAGSPLDMSGVVPKVIKAFAKAGVEIPPHTKKVLGITNSNMVNKKKYLSSSNTRASSWNATKNGYYVRPGPGQQPYFFKVPAGLAAGRKTVEKLYITAGRNIPVEVRRIFKIPDSFVVTTKPAHKITMGLNKVLRINDRQATRLTKSQLVQIARNMGIAEVNNKMAPNRLISYIKRTSGITKANLNYDVKIADTKYKFLTNIGSNRIQKTIGSTQTTRNWATVPAEEQNKIAKAFLSKNMHANYDALSKANKFSALLAIKYEKSKVSPNKKSPNSGSNSNSNNNFAKELERDLLIEGHKTTLKSLIGNKYYKNEDVKNFMNKLNAEKLTKKADIDRFTKNFAKKAKLLRKHALVVANYKKKIVVPAFIPNNKKNAFAAALLAAGTNVNTKGVYPTQKVVQAIMKTWISVHNVPMQGYAAHNKENVVTGVITKVPAYAPKAKNLTFKAPKPSTGTPPVVKPKVVKPVVAVKIGGNSKKKYKFPSNANNIDNLGNQMLKKGLSTKSTYSWSELLNLGINKKHKAMWFKSVSPGS